MLLILKVEAEREAVAKAVVEWKENKGLRPDEEDIYATEPELSDADRLEKALKEEGKERR